jgi:hypothetical protein
LSLKYVNRKDCEQHDEHREALLWRGADPENSKRTLQCSLEFEEFVKQRNAEASSRQRQSQYADTNPAPAVQQKPGAENGYETHDKRSLIETEGAGLEIEAQTQKNAAAQRGERNH